MKELPQGWRAVALEEVAERVDYGFTASATREHCGPQFLRITDIQDGQVDWSTVPYCRGTGPMEDLFLQNGDIVFARTGATTGKSFLIDTCPQGAVFASYLIRVRPGKMTWPGFLRHYFSTPDYWRQISSNAVGSAQIGVNATRLKQIRFSLPPLPEQRRIAAILDKADAVRRRKREFINLLDGLRRSVFLDMFGHPTINPHGLPSVRLGDVCEIVGGGTPSRAVPEYFHGSLCWATCKDMGIERLSDTQEHITDLAVEQSATKVVPAGSVLVVVKSKVLLHRLPVAVTEVETAFGQDLKALRLRSDWPADYVAQHLRIGEQALLDRARGVNTEGLTLEHLREYRLLAPQKEARSQYAKIDASVREKWRRATASLAGTEALFSSLQQRAFQGQL